MEKTTRNYNFDYENDTTIEYVNTGLYSMLNCSFTSEDPDYGTDTIHYTANPAVSMEQMAYEMVRELAIYLNKKDQRQYADITDAERIAYDGYGNSTLYAIEHALSDIAKAYRARSWFGHLEDVTREIAKRMITDGEKTFSFCESNQEEWDEYSPEEYEQFAASWYGIKRLSPVFDNGSYEYLVAIGYYGGGDFTSAYLYDDERNTEDSINELARSICEGIERITDLKPQSIVFATEEKEEK